MRAPNAARRARIAGMSDREKLRALILAYAHWQRRRDDIVRSPAEIHGTAARYIEVTFRDLTVDQAAGHMPPQVRTLYNHYLRR